MLETIERLSNFAQIAMAEKLNELNDENSQESQDLIKLRSIYAQLDKLIQATRNQHVLVGAYILSRQLSQSQQELNAEQLLRNFLKVLDHPLITTWSLQDKPEQESCIDLAKTLSVSLLICMVVPCSLFIPMLFMSYLPGLMLLISALPLLITYACDEPFSMSRFYQEMAGIEKALAYSVLGSTLVLLLFFSQPEITVLMIGIMFLSMVITGLAFLLHSNHLQSKHEGLKTDSSTIHQNVTCQNNNRVLNFFKADPQNAESFLTECSYLDHIKETLSTIKA